MPFSRKTIWVEASENIGVRVNDDYAAEPTITF